MTSITVRIESLVMRKNEFLKSSESTNELGYTHVMQMSGLIDRNDQDTFQKEREESTPTNSL